MEKLKTLKGRLKKDLKKICKNKEDLKTWLEILLLLTPIFVLMLTTFEKLNFTNFYMIPSEYKELDIYRVLKKIVLAFIILTLYYNCFFLEITTSIKDLKNIILFLKRKSIKNENRKKIIRGIKSFSLFFSLLYVVLIGGLLGIFYYFILADSLTHFFSEKIQSSRLQKPVSCGWAHQTGIRKKSHQTAGKRKSGSEIKALPGHSGRRNPGLASALMQPPGRKILCQISHIMNRRTSKIFRSCGS